MKLGAIFLLAVPMVLGSGCLARYPLNQPLSTNPAPPSLAAPPTRPPANSDSLCVMLFFSGGGTRAAALSYGILEELARTEVIWEGERRRLLDEVDLISSVSGGSFTAAYYCLHRDRIFSEFEHDFLKRDVQSALTWRLFSPAYVCRLFSPYFSRSDMAAEYYDRRLFHGATFGHGSALNLKPSLLINATDVSHGARFSFIQEQFDWIGSDLSSFPLSRAVAASSAVPGVLSPITLRNYGGATTETVRRWDEAAVAPSGLSIRQRSRYRDLHQYANVRDHAFVHLVDGGLSDNLGLGAVVEALDSPVNRSHLSQHLPQASARKLMAIIVNARTLPDRRWRRSPSPPGFFETLSSVSRLFMNRNTVEASQMLEETLSARRQRVLARPGGTNSALDFHLIEIKFEDLPDAQERRYCQELPTRLRLRSRAVDRLRQAASRLLLQAPEYQRFLAEVGTPPRTAPPRTSPE